MSHTRFVARGGDVLAPPVVVHPVKDLGEDAPARLLRRPHDCAEGIQDLRNTPRGRNQPDQELDHAEQPTHVSCRPRLVGIK